VNLTDNIPAGTTYVTGSFKQTAISGNGTVNFVPTFTGGTTPKVTATATTFADGASATFQFVVKVNASTTGTITDKADVSTPTTESDNVGGVDADNHATVDTTVSTLA